MNRLITGPGVVCGLNVTLTDDKESIIVQPGLAIDRCGREIIVNKPSRPVPLPALPPYEEAGKKQEYSARRQSKQGAYCIMPYAHVVICYHECESDPVPAMAGDCEAVAMCAAGTIREQYEVEVRDRFAQRPKHGIENVVYDGQIDHEALVRYVTLSNCRNLPDDCCLPLANIELRDVGDGWEPDPDITIRPIVYTNRLLFNLIQEIVNPDYGKEEEE